MNFPEQPDDEPTYKFQERENDFYNNILVQFQDNEVLSFISALPTPMFLDLDRRYRANLVFLALRSHKVC
jgi:hypothetical protein